MDHINSGNAAESGEPTNLDHHDDLNAHLSPPNYEAQGPVRLPTEIIDQIAASLSDDYKTLSKFALICRLWKEVAYPHLYKTLTLTCTHQIFEFGFHDQAQERIEEQKVQSLQERKHLWPLVKTVVVRSVGDNNCVDKPTNFHFPNLDNLCIGAWASGTCDFVKEFMRTHNSYTKLYLEGHDVTEVIRICPQPFPLLSLFSCSDRAEYNKFHLHSLDAVVDVLKSQVQLRKEAGTHMLGFNRFAYGGANVSNKFLNDCAKYLALLDTVDLSISGKESNQKATFDVFARLVKSLPKLECLEFSGIHELPPDWFDQLSPYLPCLKSLDFSLPDSYGTDNISTLVSNFAKNQLVISQLDELRMQSMDVFDFTSCKESLSPPADAILDKHRNSNLLILDIFGITFSSENILEFIQHYPNLMALFISVQRPRRKQENDLDHCIQIILSLKHLRTCSLMEGSKFIANFDTIELDYIRKKFQNMSQSDPYKGTIEDLANEIKLIFAPVMQRRETDEEIRDFFGSSNEEIRDFMDTDDEEVDGFIF